MARVIELAKARELPLVVDADGLWLIERRPELVEGYAAAVLTPNAAEFRRLAQALQLPDANLRQLCDRLRGPVVIQKGKVDLIGRANCDPLSCLEPGAPRRPGAPQPLGLNEAARRSRGLPGRKTLGETATGSNL